MRDDMSSKMDEMKDKMKKDKDDDEDEDKPVKAGYRPLYGSMGLTTFFYLLFLFPLAILGMMFLSPMFVILLIVCIVLFVVGAVFIEKEHRDPRVPDHEWQKEVEEEAKED